MLFATNACDTTEIQCLVRAIDTHWKQGRIWYGAFASCSISSIESSKCKQLHPSLEQRQMSSIDPGIPSASATLHTPAALPTPSFPPSSAPLPPPLPPPSLPQENKVLRSPPSGARRRTTRAVMLSREPRRMLSLTMSSANSTKYVGCGPDGE